VYRATGDEPKPDPLSDFWSRSNDSFFATAKSTEIVAWEFGASKER
jgi:hypothetical protein